jgi:hypothetical protein
VDNLQRTCLGAIAAAAMVIGASSVAHACDEFAGHLVSVALAPAVEGLKCNDLGKAGLDKPGHHLRSVCYTSNGATSDLKVIADLRCKTSDKAFVKASISDTVTANAKVRGADCQLISVDVQASGDLGKLLMHAFDVNGIARIKLQKALDKLCQ